VPTLESHAIVAITQDGKVIAKSRTWEVIPERQAGVAVALVATVPDLRMVETVLQVEFYSDPDTNNPGGYMDKKITGNVVGMTIYGLTASTTLYWEVTAVGPP